MNTVFARMFRAARLDPSLYDEVGADDEATLEAGAIVLFASVAAELGMPESIAGVALLTEATAGLFLWGMWALSCYVIGAKMLPEPQTRTGPARLLRAIGYSSSPGCLAVLGGIPVIGPLVGPIAQLWVFVAMVIAIRQALDYTSTSRAVAVLVLGFILQVVVGTISVMIAHTLGVSV